MPPSGTAPARRLGLGQVSAYDHDPVRQPGRPGITHQRPHSGAGCEELSDNLAADIAGCTGHKNLTHDQVSLGRTPKYSAPPGANTLSG